MKKEEIVSQLNINSNQVIDLVNSLSKFELEHSQDEKWNILHHFEHLLRSIQPLNKAMKIPLPGLKILFGTSKRDGMSFDETILKYKKALSDGGKASGRYIPSLNKKKKVLLRKYTKHVDRLNTTINKWKEEDLDKYLLPHPLMGKLNIREMLYFTIYHTSHHLQLMNENLN